MSPISITLNLLLAAMLGLTLWVGWRLNRRLTALRDGQAQFAAAVADLDRAAARAERGLAELRAAGDETLELLSSRIEKGRELAVRLERLNDAARASLDRVPEPQASPAPVKTVLPAAIAALQKVWSPKPAAEPSVEEAEAAAESLVLKLSKAEALDEPRVAQFAPRPSSKSRTIVDDDLFETPVRPTPRILAGGR
jgi:hypothetical protein